MTTSGDPNLPDDPMPRIDCHDRPHPMTTLKFWGGMLVWMLLIGGVTVTVRHIVDTPPVECWHGQRIGGNEACNRMSNAKGDFIR